MAENMNLAKIIESLPVGQAAEMRLTLADYIAAQKRIITAAMYLADDPVAIVSFYDWVEKHAGREAKHNRFTKTLRAASMAVALEDDAAFLFHVTEGLERISQQKQEEKTDEASNSRDNG
jgi:hypothetical protein